VLAAAKQVQAVRLISLKICAYASSSEFIPDSLCRDLFINRNARSAVRSGLAATTKYQAFKI
jgi:hypothetical protein